MSKICDFPCLFMTWPKIQHRIYDRCGYNSCPKHNLWRSFNGDLFADDEKVAFLKNIPNLWLEWKIVTQFETKMAKIDTLLWPKRLKNHTLWGRTHLYCPGRGVSHRPLGQILHGLNVRWHHIANTCFPYSTKVLLATCTTALTTSNEKLMICVLVSSGRKCSSGGGATH